PSHAKNVKLHHDPMPLFAKHKVEGYLADMFNPTVQLKSGGYIVIGITEALVAIDVNSGRATKEGSIEETATKTNLEAAEEVARQVRLRDLAGLIVIDFIDMDERRNNVAVEKRLKDKLKTDRARIQVGRISVFGLLEMSRQRLRPGMLEATTQPCKACHGTGLIRSDDSLALSILRQLEEEGTKRRASEVLVTAPVGIVNYLLNDKRDYLMAIEARYGLSIRIEADPTMVPPDYKLERFKTATRKVATVASVISMDASLMDDIEDAEVVDEDIADAPEASGASETAEAPAGADDAQPKKKRRRRRGGRGRRKPGNGDASSDENGDMQDERASEDADEPEAAPVETVDAEAPAAVEATPTTEGEVEAPAAEAKPKRTRAPAKPRKKAEPKAKKPAVAADAATEDAPVAEAEAAPEPAASAEQAAAAPEPHAVVVEEAAPAPEPVMETATAEPEPVANAETGDATRSKKRGWWSRG
ncbi:MAG: ribonuclease E/G, partial [Roseicyclus sp.]